MLFWGTMLGFGLILPCLMIVFGRMFMKAPPKNINMAFGYRTGMSMKNQDTWDYAHRYFGSVFWKTGAAMIIPTAALYLLMLGRDEDALGLAGMVIELIQVFVMLVPMIMTEAELRKVFNRDGTRK